MRLLIASLLIVAALSGAGALSAAARPGAIVYPVAPTDNTVDTYYGTSVPDPYRPLESIDTPATRLTGRTTTGLEVHADMLAQLLDGRLPHRVPALALWLAAIIVVGGAGWAGFTELSPARNACVIAGSLMRFCK